MATMTAERQGQHARVDALFERLAELQGQRNVIDAQIVDVVRELDRDDLWGITGARSLEACVAWKTGSSRSHAEALAAVARRVDELPRCVGGLRAGSLSLDQVAVIAERAVSGAGVDEHYATLAESATVAQLRTALRMAPRPRPDRPAEPERSVTKLTDEEFAYWRIKLPHVDAATFDAALQSHLDALVAEWKRDHGDRDAASEQAPPFPTVADAFLRLVSPRTTDRRAAGRAHRHAAAAACPGAPPDRRPAVGCHPYGDRTSPSWLPSRRSAVTMALDARTRSSIYDRLAPLIGEDNANALMSEFPSVEADELVTKQFLRAELLATRGDLRAEMAGLRDDLRAEMAGLRDDLRAEMADLRRDMAALETRLTVRMGAGLGATTAVLGALIALG